MATEDHKILSDIIKDVHNDLRLKYQACKDGAAADDLWDDHCKRLDVLSRYSSAMHRLANTHWKNNNTSTRIDWCYSVIMDYFVNGGVEKALKRDLRLQSVGGNDGETICKLDADMYKNTKIQLLDVGSCYNPFSEYDNLASLALDICPATSNVHKCDFLKLDVVKNEGEDFTTAAVNLPPHITTLPEKFFHVVVFSLFLEYLPSQHQRLLCCAKAERLLMENGLLVIVTPDSKHQNHNAKMMKSWKQTLESLGLRRVKYEKQTHLHCLAFRKIDEDSKMRLQSVAPDECCGLYIPQDFREISQPPLMVEARAIDPDDAKQTFLELPFSCCLE